MFYFRRGLQRTNFFRHCLPLKQNRKTQFCFFTTAGNRETLKLLDDVAKLLPNQAILANFVHRNPLEEFEEWSFDAAVQHAHQLESVESPGARVSTLLHVDPRKRVNEAMSELCAVFIDSGAARWRAPGREHGFLRFFASLEALGWAPWRAHARVLAQRVLASESGGAVDAQHWIELASAIVDETLVWCGVANDDNEQRESALRATLLELRGWAGMFRRLEQHSDEAAPDVRATLVEFAAVHLILTRSSLAAVLARAGRDPRSTMTALYASSSNNDVAHTANDSDTHGSAIAYADQQASNRVALEQSFEQSLLAPIAKLETSILSSSSSSSSSSSLTSNNNARKLQIFTCIDDRECSLRRHFESLQPHGVVETFGVAGLFGLPLEFAALGDQVSADNEKSVVREQAIVERQERWYARRRRMMTRVGRVWERASFSPVGSLLLSALAPLTLAHTVAFTSFPSFYAHWRQYLEKKWLSKPQSQFSTKTLDVKQSAARLAGIFKSLGMRQATDFAPLLLVLGHGASSLNNPYYSAYNCGACAGREGGSNARLFAQLANDEAVRRALAATHNIVIPPSTYVVGGLHDTTADRIDLPDTHRAPESHRAAIDHAHTLAEQAVRRNAAERCARFLLAPTALTHDAALRHVRQRAADYAEVRPELNHAANAAAFVGRRALTARKFFDRRMFMSSYDPFSDNDAGSHLETVLAPALTVCSGINLEYLFSTIDSDHHGAGTKAPLNVVGHVGVLQGTNGDLRPGLPCQMTEMHVPIRCLFVVDAPLKRVEAIFDRRPDLFRLVKNEWVRFIVRDSENGEFLKHCNGAFKPMESIDKDAAPLQSVFAPHRAHGLALVERERYLYTASVITAAVSCVACVSVFGAGAMHAYGALVALYGTVLGVAVMNFSRRYLHGELMFGRFCGLSAALIAGFNVVATAPSLEVALTGWGVFGFASAFLIGAYNERVTVRNNATYVFAAYQLSDLTLMVCIATLASGHQALAASGLIAAALIKSSQVPLSALFVRSMEGPTPASALGYAGLSAHIGIVLLSATTSIWYPFVAARVVLASVGLATAFICSIVSKVRADRKGALAHATAAAIGLMYVLLAAGYVNTALLLAAGHAAFRVGQILKAPHAVQSHRAASSALGTAAVGSRAVPQRLYSLAWLFNRYHTDFSLMHELHWLGRLVTPSRPLPLSRPLQWTLTGATLMAVGLPLTPFAVWREHAIVEHLVAHPLLVSFLALLHIGISVALVRFLLTSVLTKARFARQFSIFKSKK